MKLPVVVGNVESIPENRQRAAPSACRRHAALQREPQKRCATARADDTPATKIERAIGKCIGEAVVGTSQRIGPVASLAQFRRCIRIVRRTLSDRSTIRVNGRFPETASQMAASANRSSSTRNASTPHCID